MNSRALLPVGVGVLFYGACIVSLVWLLCKAWPLLQFIVIMSLLAGTIAYPPYGE